MNIYQMLNNQVILPTFVDKFLVKRVSQTDFGDTLDRKKNGSEMIRREGTGCVQDAMTQGILPNTCSSAP